MSISFTEVGLMALIRVTALAQPYQFEKYIKGDAHCINRIYIPVPVQQLDASLFFPSWCCTEHCPGWSVPNRTENKPSQLLAIAANTCRALVSCLWTDQWTAVIPSTSLIAGSAPFSRSTLMWLGLPWKAAHIKAVIMAPSRTLMLRPGIYTTKTSLVTIFINFFSFQKSPSLTVARYSWGPYC